MAHTMQIIPSGQRTATTDSEERKPLKDFKGALFLVEVTAGTTLDLTDIKIQVPFGVNTINWETLYTLAFTSAITSTGRYMLLLYPQATMNSTNIDGTPVVGSLPPRFRVEVTHGNSNAATYSVEAFLLP